MRKFIAIVLLSLILFGCVHQTIAFKGSESLPPEQLSSLVTDSKDVTIEWINDKKITTFQQLWNSKWNAEVLLKPDAYKIAVKYWNGPTFKQHINSHYLLKIKTQPGHTYKIKHKIVDLSAKLWIVDLSNSESVGKVLASENEPITQRDTVLDHSIYFKYHPPKKEGWFIAFRDNYQTSLVQKGGHEDETYAINIIIFELPNIESKDAYFKFINKGWIKDTDPKRFKIIKKEIHPYEGSDGFCACYHLFVEDKKAKKMSKSKEPMILEMVGYVCRHPANKNIGVKFDFSHRYYKGDEDKNLVQRAKELFERLECI